MLSFNVATAVTWAGDRDAAATAALPQGRLQALQVSAALCQGSAVQQQCRSTAASPYEIIQRS
jgi:hypothetical protein